MDIYGGKNPRDLPVYAVPEAAHYLRLPAAALRNWAAGVRYKTAAGSRTAPPLIITPTKQPRLLSFLNLVEAHVLSAMRRHHGLAMWRVRRAIDAVGRELGSKHPLADERFMTDGVDLFVQRVGRLINITDDEQVMIREAIEMNLERVEWDAATKLASRFFPYVGTPDDPKVVVIDPFVSFGRPVLLAAGVPTAELAERRIAGDSVEAIADDFGLTPAQVEEALRYELRVAA